MVSNSGTMLTRERVAAQQPDLLQQHADLEQVGHRLALRDHVVRQRGGAEAAVDVRRRRARIASSAARALRVRRGAASAASRGAGELAREQRDALVLRQRRVVGGDAGAREQLGDDRLVHVGVLAQVERREVEAEHLDRALQRREAPRRRAAPRRARRASARSRRRSASELRRRRVRRQLARAARAAAT